MTDAAKTTAPFSAEALMAAAQAEINQELADRAKGQIKGKLRELADAKKVVANIETQIAKIMGDIKVETV